VGVRDVRTEGVLVGYCLRVVPRHGQPLDIRASRRPERGHVVAMRKSLESWSSYAQASSARHPKGSGSATVC
jgi:hypothetical protein